MVVPIMTAYLVKQILRDFCQEHNVNVMQDFQIKLVIQFVDSVMLLV